MSEIQKADQSSQIQKHQFQFGNGQITLQYAGRKLINVMAKVPLTKAENDLYEIRGKWALTAAAYHKLNRVAGINIVTPPTLFYNGQEQSNPYVIEAKEPGVIKALIMRRMGIGFSPTGNLVIIDRTLYFNIATYFQQSLMKIANQKPGVAKMGVRYFCPFAPDIEPKKGDDDEWYVVDKNAGKVWLFRQVEAGSGLWLEISHPEMNDAFSEHTQRQKFAERIAQTILDRNILKTHPCIGIQNVVPDQKGIAQVTVYGWKHDFTQQDFQDIVEKTVKGEEIEAEVIRETDEVDIQDEVDVEDVVEVEGNRPIKEEPVTPETPVTPEATSTKKETLFDMEEEEEEIRKNLNSYAKSKGIDLNKEARSRYEVLSWRQLSGDALIDFRDQIRKMGRKK